MNNAISDYQSAEEARKRHEYPEAGRWFGEAWRTNPSADVGWRYAFCLRKAGHLAFAEKIAREVYADYPNEKMCRSELLWALYAKEIKQPESESKDLERALNAADEILSLQPEPFALNRTAMEIASIAKELDRWDVVVIFTEYVDPMQLEAQRTSAEGRAIMSEREQWYLMRSNALLETDATDAAQIVTSTGLEQFPGSKFLARNHARALYKSGAVAEAANAYRRLVTRRDADWYFKTELAEIELELKNPTDAYTLLCDALSNPQAEEYKVKSLEKLASVALALGKLDVAAHHVAWTKAIRLLHWGKVPASLTTLEAEVRKALQEAQQPWTNEDAEIRELKRLCEAHWKTEETTGKEYVSGVVKALPENKDFAFLRRDDTGEDVFAKVNEIPNQARHIGAKVIFVPEQSYDSKKARDSWRARHIKIRES